MIMMLMMIMVRNTGYQLGKARLTIIIAARGATARIKSDRRGSSITETKVGNNKKELRP